MLFTKSEVYLFSRLIAAIVLSSHFTRLSEYINFNAKINAETRGRNDAEKIEKGLVINFG